MSSRTFESNNHGDEHPITNVMSDNHYDPNSQNTSKAEDDRKLFVGGLTWDTTVQDLREYFSKYGPILDCSIKHDPTTGRSRGFAFLVFDRKEIVEKILSENEHIVKGRKVDPKPAHRRLAANHLQHPLSSSHPLTSNNNHPSTNNNRKVFIGGVDPNFPDVQLREYFSQFGVIDEIDLPYDKEKNERRPFCFISFQNEQSAQEVLRIQKHSIGDVIVDVKRAKPKTSGNALQHQQQQQQQQQQLYDPYGQQNLYGNYGSTVSSYGNNAYSTADPYSNWNAYNYNQTVNSAAYAYNNNGGSNSASSSYSQYGQHPINSQYSYGPTNSIGVNEYYSQYGYGAGTAPQTNSGVYADPNAYGATGYDYNQYLASMGENSLAGQGAETTSTNEKNNYDHENRYALNKAAMLSNGNYQSYPIT